MDWSTRLQGYLVIDGRVPPWLGCCKTPCVSNPLSGSLEGVCVCVCVLFLAHLYAKAQSRQVAQSNIIREEAQDLPKEKL